MPRLKNATPCSRCGHTNVKDAEGYCAVFSCLCHCVKETKMTNWAAKSYAHAMGYNEKEIKVASINDWASKAANQIISALTPDISQERIATIIATHAVPLVALLRESRREHSNGAHDECPMANPTYSYNVGEPCDCGADAWNARVEAALAGLSKPVSDSKQKA